MSKKIKVIIKQPHRVPYSTNISNTLENLQRTVGGYIELLRPDLGVPRMAFIVNKEGKLRGLHPNFQVYGEVIAGTAVFLGLTAGKDGIEFDDIPMTFKEFKEMFPMLWLNDGEYQG